MKLEERIDHALFAAAEVGVVARNVGFHRPGQPLKVDLQQPAWIVLLGPPETRGRKPKDPVVAWLPKVQIMVCDPACSYPSAAIFLCCYSTVPSIYARRGPFCWPGFCRRVSPTVRNAHGRWFRLLAAEGTSIPRLTPLPGAASPRSRPWPVCAVQAWNPHGPFT